MPLSWCSPTSSNVVEPPSIMSRTVCDAQNVPSAACCSTRAARLTAMPENVAVAVDFDLTGVHASTDRDADAGQRVSQSDAAGNALGWTVERDQQTVAGALHHAAAVLVDETLAIRSWLSSNARQTASPRSADWRVDPTMSVNSTVANLRVEVRPTGAPVANSIRGHRFRDRSAWLTLSN